MADWVIEPLDRAHERGAFSCGNAALDTFLHTLVSQYEKRRLGKTYVAVLPGKPRVLGYYTLAAGAIACAHVPEKAAMKLPKHVVPAILLARLASDQCTRGQGLGAALLKDALLRTLDMSGKLGVHAMVVEAIDKEAKAFYEKFGFVPLLDNEFHLYLPLATIVQGSIPPKG